LECGSLLPLFERSRRALSESGGKPLHSKAASPLTKNPGSRRGFFVLPTLYFFSH
jgi:hypothetical protein